MVDRSFLKQPIQDFLNQVPGDLPYHQLPVQTIREAFGSAPILEVDTSEVTVEDISIPAHDDGHEISVKVFRPKHVSSDTVLPAFIYLPGGGFVIPHQGAHHYLAGKHAVEINCAVLFVHYSLAPEAKFPIGLEECYSVGLYATSTEGAKKLNIDPTKVAIGGDSAGANLTIGVSYLAKQRKAYENDLKYQIAYYPNTDIAMNTESHEKFKEGYFVTGAFAEYVYSQYVSEEQRSDKLFTLLNMSQEDLAGLPPVFLLTCEADMLRDEGEELGRRLLAAKVPTISLRVNGVTHGFMSVAPIIVDETYLTIATVASILRKAFSKV